MDSINRNQPEPNHQDLRGDAAVAKIKDVVTHAANCFFRTAVSTGDSHAVRPMNVRTVDDAGTLWFLSAADSHKNAEVERDAAVELFFQAEGRSEFLHLTGRATVTRDRAKIEELWEPILKTWFTEGKDDPRITVIAVRPTGGYYWDTKHGTMVAGIKMMVGAMLGKTLDDSIEGTVTV